MSYQSPASTLVASFERLEALLDDAGGRTSAALVHSSVFLGAVSACKVLTVCLLLGVSPNLAAVVAFLAPLGVYNLDKAADVEADAATYPERAAFVRAAGPWFVVCSAGALAAAVLLGALGGALGLAVTLFPGLTTAVYTFPILPGRGPDRLKDVYLVNTGLVAAAWAVPVAVLPAAYASHHFASTVTHGSATTLASATPLASVVTLARSLPVLVVPAPGTLAGVAVALAWFFCRTTIAAEVRNVRDRDGDAAEGVRTLPVVRGVPLTRRVLYALDVLSLLVVAAGAFAGAVPAVAPLAVLPAVAFSLYTTHTVGRTDADSAWCTRRDLEYPLTLLALAGLLAVA